jgi:ubiquinone/menaquinone biosynthesis C-methylase UbiE
MPSGRPQDRAGEREFFDRHAETVSEYNVLSEKTNRRLVAACLERCRLRPGMRVLDLGCGSGVFSRLLSRQGLNVTGVDISPRLIELGARAYPDVKFLVGDAEALPFENGQFDCVFLGGLIHHFPDPSALAGEVARQLCDGGMFFAFDPNRRNPFMWLYRDHDSPFYSSKGVTPGERPVLAEQVTEVFAKAGFRVSSETMSVAYRYAASPLMRMLLPACNLAEKVLLAPGFLSPHRAFVLTYGAKLTQPSQVPCKT